MNQVYVNDHQNPDLAKRSELPKPNTGRHTEHTYANLNRNHSPEEEYIEFSDLGQHTNVNFHRQQMINKGEILSLYSVIVFQYKIQRARLKETKKKIQVQSA